MAGVKRFRRLQKAIKPYGFVIKTGRTHNGIYDLTGKRVCILSSSPTSVFQAEDNTMKFMRKTGLLPKDAKLWGNTK